MKIILNDYYCSLFNNCIQALYPLNFNQEQLTLETSATCLRDEVDRVAKEMMLFSVENQGDLISLYYALIIGFTDLNKDA